jgi:hypothetical protein
MSPECILVKSLIVKKTRIKILKTIACRNIKILIFLQPQQCDYKSDDEDNMEMHVQSDHSQKFDIIIVENATHFKR